MNKTISDRVSSYLSSSEVGTEFLVFTERCFISPYIMYSCIPIEEMDEALDAWGIVAKDALTLNLNVFELLAIGFEDVTCYEPPHIFKKYRHVVHDILEYFVTGRGAEVIDERILIEARSHAKDCMARHLNNLLNLDY